MSKSQLKRRAIQKGIRVEEVPHINVDVAALDAVRASFSEAFKEQGIEELMAGERKEGDDEEFQRRMMEVFKRTFGGK